MVRRLSHKESEILVRKKKRPGKEESLALGEPMLYQEQKHFPIIPWSVREIP